MRTAIALSFALVAPGALAAAEIDTSLGAVEVTPMLTGLREPWSIGFLPDGGVLVTERGGRLALLADGAVNEVRGVPEVFARGQGGLFDVLVPRDFPTSRAVFLSFAKPQSSGAGTAVGVGRLSADGTRLEDFREIFETSPSGSTSRHFGGRLVEAPDRSLFLTMGDRGQGPRAQDVSYHQGSVLRITRDGAAAPGNPGLTRPEIWSYGHRNPQGAALDAAGQLWVVEHGAQGGDEINRITGGANYGWPVITYGRDYDGSKIGEGTAKPGMEQPETYWDPSIAPSGYMIYSGKLWPEWTGDHFVGSLKFHYIARLDGTPLREVEQIKSAETLRVRDIREAPDGSIWFLSVVEGAAYRLAPSD